MWSFRNDRIAPVKRPFRTSAWPLSPWSLAGLASDRWLWTNSCIHCGRTAESPELRSRPQPSTPNVPQLRLSPKILLNFNNCRHLGYLHRKMAFGFHQAGKTVGSACRSPTTGDSGAGSTQGREAPREKPPGFPRLTAAEREGGTNPFRPRRDPFRVATTCLTNDSAASKMEDLSPTYTREIIEDSFPEPKR